MRIQTEDQLDELINRITAIVTPERVEDFIASRFTSYDRETKTDAHVTLKDGKHYLPYTNMIKFIARLKEYGEETKLDDDFDI